MFGCTVTEAPTIRSGCSKAEIKVPALAANTEISFASDLVFVNEGNINILSEICFLNLLSALSFLFDFEKAHAADTESDYVCNSQRLMT